MLTCPELWCLARNAWYVFHGIAWDPLHAALAVYNCSSRWEELQQSLGLVVYPCAMLYGMVLLSPLLRWGFVWTMSRGFSDSTREKVTDKLAALALASRRTSLLAYEAAWRTSFVFENFPEIEEEPPSSGGWFSRTCWCWFREERERRRRIWQQDRERRRRERKQARIIIRTFRKIASADELSLVPVPPPQTIPEQLSRTSRRRSCCIRLGCLPIFPWSLTWPKNPATWPATWPVFQAELAQRLQDRPFRICIHFATFVLHPYIATTNHVVQAFPPSFCLHLKVHFWSAIFHIIVYVSYVVSLHGTWWEPTWLLKLLMAVYNLWGMRRVSAVWQKWDVSRLGILSQNQLPKSWAIDSIWPDWSRAAFLKFNWCCNVDMWQLLEKVRDEEARAGTSTPSTSIASGHPDDPMLGKQEASVGTPRPTTSIASGDPDEPMLGKRDGSPILENSQ